MLTRRLLDFCSTKGGRATLSILIFHRVLPPEDENFLLDITASKFEVLMQHVRQSYNVLPLSKALLRLHDGTLPSRALSITFDDGYADNLHVAAPILYRNNLPATVFVATSFLDGGCMWNDIVAEACRSTERVGLDLAFAGLGYRSIHSIEDRRRLTNDLLSAFKYMGVEARDAAARRVAEVAETSIPTTLMMSRSSLRQLQEFGIEVGAHTRRHPILAMESDASAWSEIAGSRDDLKDILGVEVSLFAYPNGKPGADYRSEHARMAREAGFVAAVSTRWGVSRSDSDQFQLPRFTPWRTKRTWFDVQMAENMLRAGP